MTLAYEIYFSAMSLLTILLVGCDRHDFAHQIANADRVVLSGSNYAPVEIVVNGDKAREIVNTVASAKRLI